MRAKVDFGFRGDCKQVDSKSLQTSRIDAMETCDLGIPYLGMVLGFGLGIRSRVRVRLRVRLGNPNPNPSTDS